MRICIYPSDVQRLTGRSENYSRAVIRTIKKHYGKEKHQFVSIDEFCEYSGLSPELVRDRLKLKAGTF